jgi:hypothetical protein
MHYINWTEGKKRKLRELIEGGTSYNQAAKVMKISPSTVFTKCAELGIHKPKEPTGTERILLACDTPNGLDSREISMAAHLGKQRVNAILRDLMSAGKIHCAGKHNFNRYFVSKEAADAYDLKAAQEELDRKAAKKLAKIVQKRERDRLHMQRIRATRKAREQEAKAAIAPPKPLLVTPPPVVEIVGGVKVTRYQTPPNLFDFTPPAGWRGQITHDWLDRRLGAA